MATPSATQYHGTVVVAIVAAVAALAIAASTTLRGIGPWEASVVGWSHAVDGIAVEVEVVNAGERQGRAKCRIQALDARGRTLAARNIVSDPVAGGGRLLIAERLPLPEETPAEVRASCQ
jgi:hypothetical protein